MRLISVLVYAFAVVASRSAASEECADDDRTAFTFVQRDVNVKAKVKVDSGPLLQPDELPSRSTPSSDMPDQVFSSAKVHEAIPQRVPKKSILHRAALASNKPGKMPEVTSLEEVEEAILDSSGSASSEAVLHSGSSTHPPNAEYQKARESPMATLMNRLSLIGKYMHHASPISRPVLLAAAVLFGMLIGLLLVIALLRSILGSSDSSSSFLKAFRDDDREERSVSKSSFGQARPSAVHTSTLWTLNSDMEKLVPMSVIGDWSPPRELANWNNWEHRRVQVKHADGIVRMEYLSDKCSEVKVLCEFQELGTRGCISILPPMQMMPFCPSSQSSNRKKGDGGLPEKMYAFALRYEGANVYQKVFGTHSEDGMLKWIALLNDSKSETPRSSLISSVSGSVWNRIRK